MLQRRLSRGSTLPTVSQVIAAGDLIAMRAVEAVSVHPDVLRYIVALAAATRSHSHVEVGASPRAELDLVQMSRARRCCSAAIL